MPKPKISQCNSLWRMPQGDSYHYNDWNTMRQRGLQEYIYHQMATCKLNWSFGKNRHTKMDVATTCINLKTVLLTKISYPLMVTTFTFKEGNSILQPALLQALPLLGINWHFPRAMVYGHESHHGLGITHLYNKQGFLHILALIKFPMQPGIMGELLNHSYKVTQVELGLPGEIFQYPYKDWGQTITQC